MLQTPNKATLPDQAGKYDLEVENNIKEGTKDTVSMTINGQKAYIKIKDLYGLVLVLCDQEQQDQLMPIRQTQVMKYVKQHRIRAQKPLKAGDELVVNCHVDVPVTVVEGLRGLVERRKFM